MDRSWREKDRLKLIGSDDSQPSSETWARCLKRGDIQAIQEVRLRVKKILRYGPLSIPSNERDDLEQEVMAEIWQAVNRPHFDFSYGFWGFVEVVTARRCIDWLRSRRAKVPLPEDVSSGQRGPLQNAVDREQHTLASRILSTLEPECQDLIIFRLRDNLSYREISSITEKSEGALRIQFYRCIQRARKAGRKLSRNVWERSGQTP